MREIKFRGKRIDNGEWIYGLLNVYQDKLYVTWEIIEAPSMENPAGLWSHFHYEVDPKTIGQYTGLIDKNGLEVFEGDIVIHPYDNAQQIVFGKIGYDGRWNGLTGFGFKNDDYDFIELQWYNDPELIEVIGNIHENPELLNQ